VKAADKQDGRIGLITGGVGDLGFASAQKMASMGMKLALLDIADEQKADVRLRVLREKGTEVMYLRADVSDRGAVEGTLESVWHEFGRLDVCMCNAGIALDIPFLDFPVEQWNRHIDINLTGYFHVCQAVARRWVASKLHGKFIFTGSWVQDVPYKLIAPYCVSKAGVWMLARCAAVELAPHGITVNVVAPGIVNAGLTAHELETIPGIREEFERIIPLRRMQTAEDVAEVVGFLVSSASDYLTGTSITCDGGCVVGCASAVK
jgi:NAD(P)-dependent dehydrogenase (short-subunit alcohol dehydrogenase family)